jgi:hypothetical protein
MEKYKMIFKKQSGTWSWLVSNMLHSFELNTASCDHLLVTFFSIMKWPIIVSFLLEIAKHLENHFSGMFLQYCTYALPVVAEKDCDTCAAETHLRMLLGEGIATVRKNHHRHLDRSPIGAQADISHVQRIPWAVA